MRNLEKPFGGGIRCYEWYVFLIITAYVLELTTSTFKDTRPPYDAEYSPDFDFEFELRALKR